MLTFKVTLSDRETQTKFKFIEVAECADMGDCIDHVLSTETNWFIDQISQLAN